MRLDASRALGELSRDRAVLGADLLALRQVLERFSERARRGAQPLAQVDDRELQDPLLGGLLAPCPVVHLFPLGRLNEAFPIEPTQEFGGAPVQIRLGAREADLGVSRPARRQVQVEGDARAPGADHHRVRQRAEGFGIAGLAVVAGDQVLALEFLPGPELPRTEQRHQVIQLAQVVLERRGGE